MSKTGIEIALEVLKVQILIQKKPRAAWFWRCQCDDCEQKLTIHGPFETRALAEEHANTTTQALALAAISETVCH
jgi:hypothetical protein